MQKKGLSIGLIGIAVTLIFALVGELYRFHGVLLIDLWVPIFSFSYLGWRYLKKDTLTWPKTIWPAAAFLFIGLSSLLLHSGDMSWTEFAYSFFYSIRWLSLFMLYLIVLNESPHTRKYILWMLFAFAFLLSIAGFIQFKIYPDFKELEEIGWDPHSGRLLSTWFDPNFVGGFLAFSIPLILGSALDNKKWRILLLPVAATIFIALGLSFSRSAYLALITGLFIFGLIKSWRSLVVMGTLILILMIAPGPIQDRTLSIADSIESVFTEDYTLPDESARLRFGSWEEAWLLFVDNPIIGHGYNRYEYAALEQGTLKDLAIHSASGSDSSLLTILATTGLAGFIPFFAIYIIFAKQAWKDRKSGLSTGFLASLCGLFIHSIFVNSLLFPLFMAPFFLSAGLLNLLKRNT